MSARERVEPRQVPSFVYWFVPILLAAYVIARCALLSGARRLWTDELLSWYPISASFGAMLRSTTDTINAAPPLYFVVGWIWAALFGDSALSLRLLSAATTAAAALIMFAVLRRSYRAIAASVALTILLTNDDLLFQSTEARFHSLALAEMALAVLCYQRLVTGPRPTTRLLVLNAILHAAMMMTTYVAPLYSLALLAATLLVSLRHGRDPRPACFSIAAGWLIFLPWWPVFSRHLRMGKPASRFSGPDSLQLAQYFNGYFTSEFWLRAAVLGAVVGLGAVLAVIYRGRSRRLSLRPEPLLILVPALSAVPFALYFWSRLPGHLSIFHGRYMLPTLLGWAILCAHLVSRALFFGRGIGAPKLRRGFVCLSAVAALAFAGYTVAKGLNDARLAGKPGALPDVLAAVPPNQPLVVEHIHEFLQWHFYSAQPSRLLFVVDLKAGIEQGGGGPLNQRIMAALKRQFPDQFKEVIPSEEFLATASSFSVRPCGGCQWVPLRLERNRDFTIARVNDDLMHVSRVR